jgi:FkbM family methyltransferase
MKLDEKIKNKYLLSKNFNLFKFFYFINQKLRSLKKVKKSFSSNSVDLIIGEIFKNKKKVIYIDVGCNHPFIGNNTYKLFKKGWSGINIDLDYTFINSFNFYRPKDNNIQIGISDKSGEQEMFYHHERSAINTLENSRSSKATSKKIIKTSTLNEIIQKSDFKDKEIDYVSIDVEGFELNVLKGFDLKKYKPKALSIEFIDPGMKKEEFYHQNINNIMNSDVYKFMTDNDYHFVNLLHSDLIFVSREIFLGIN